MFEEMEKYLEELKESLGKNISEKKKKEIYSNMKELLKKDFDGIIVATNNGNIVVGNKLNIIAIICSVLSYMYEHEQISKSELKGIFKTVVKVSGGKEEDDEEENDGFDRKKFEEMSAKLERDLKDFFKSL